ncbi:hypothetical protein D9758_005752 [Tetrapyrgos nigripes]|uniref:Uncharacterized protein n=1 Tax=Tetrapyrgos nigripes TaxID=182062 RepID=A0A8H5GJM8_9AGAR|nr:hypothetical protein D9758_005752 [Tetrapyrgos nigripes]
MSLGLFPFIVLLLLLLNHRVGAEETSLGQGVHNDLIGNNVGEMMSMADCKRKHVETFFLRRTRSRVTFPFLSSSSASTAAVPDSNSKHYCYCSNDCTLTSGSRRTSFAGNWVNEWKRRSMASETNFRSLVFARQDDQDNPDTQGDDKPWSALQLITPVIVGIVVAAIMLTLFVLYRRGKFTFASVKDIPSKVGGFFVKGFGARKVRKAQRNQSWVIDREAMELDSSPPPSSSSSRRPGSGGHVRLTSSTSPSDVSNHLDFPFAKPSKSGKSIWVIPGKKLWQNSTLVQKTRRVMLRIPLPWKDSIKPVKPITRGRRFEIDGSNKSTRTNSTLTNFRKAGFRTSGVPSQTTESSGPSTGFAFTDIHEPIYEEDEFSDSSSDLGLGLGMRNAPVDFREDDETENLISPSFDAERDVMVISGSSRSYFSVESGTAGTWASSNQVIPSSYGPGSETYRSNQSPERTTAPPLSLTPAGRLPPAPKYPAPVPVPPPSVPSSSSPRSQLHRLQKPSIESIIQQPLVNLPPVTKPDPRQQPDYSSIPPPPPLPPPAAPPPAQTLILPPSSLPPSIPPPPPLLPSQPSLPSFEPPTPLYTRRNPSESSISLHGNGLYQPASQTLSVIPEVNSTRTTGLGLHHHQRSESSSTSISSNNSLNGLIPQISSPPYRPSPLPQEIMIARSGTPPPPITPNSLLLSPERTPPVPISALTPPVTSPRSRPLPLPGSVATNRNQNQLPQSQPQSQHRRIFSADDAPNHRQLQPDSFADRNANRLSFSDAYAYPTPLSHTLNLSSDNVNVGNAAMLFPGPVRAAGYLQGGNMSSESVSLRDGGKRGVERELRNEESFIA